MSTVALILRQSSFDLRLVLRNGEQLLLTILIPVILLIGLTFASVVALDLPAGSARIDVAFAGVLGVAVLSSAFTSLAISIGFDRRSGALLLLATTPLSRFSILAARSISTLAVVAVQCAVLGVCALVLGWRPDAQALVAACFVVVAAVCLGSLGFALGGTLRAEATLAVANGIFILLLLAGGTALSLASLPGPLEAVMQWLPTAALGDALRGLLAGTPASLMLDVAILLAWTALGALVAVRRFRWQ